MERGLSLLPGPRRVRSAEDDDPISDSEPQQPLKELPVAEIKITKTVDDKIESEHWVTLYADKDFVMGRDVTKCTYVIDDLRVSTTQCRIYAILYDRNDLAGYPPLIFCQDKESMNGTYVNGSLIGIRRKGTWTGVVLNEGDQIDIMPHWHITVIPKYPKKSIAAAQNEIQQQEIMQFQDRFAVTSRLLGDGVLGRVHLATDLMTRKQLACKIVCRQSLRVAKKGVRDVTVREINILSELDHPNIVSLRKAFVSENTVYMFLEISRGGDLWGLIQAHGGHLSDIQGRVIMRQVVLAIQYLHSKSIVHRDLKPENVLVSHKDVGHRAMVTDFGQAISTRQPNTRMTTTELGTPGYKAPELLKGGSGGYTAKCDMWSIGVMIYAVLAGDMNNDWPRCKPEQTYKDNEKIESLVTQLIPRKSNKDEGLNPKAISLMRGLLIIDPKQRRTADEVIKHSWFASQSVKKLYEHCIQFWTKRPEDPNIIEDLPDFSGINENSVPQQEKKAKTKKLPDTTASPYFNLNQHIETTSRPRSGQKRILQALNSADTAFLDSETPSKRQRSDLYRQSREVHGKNIFGSLRKRSISQADTGDRHTREKSPYFREPNPLLGEKEQGAVTRDSGESAEKTSPSKETEPDHSSKLREYEETDEQRVLTSDSEEAAEKGPPAKEKELNYSKRQSSEEINEQEVVTRDYEESAEKASPSKQNELDHGKSRSYEETDEQEVGKRGGFTPSMRMAGKASKWFDENGDIITQRPIETKASTADHQSLAVSSLPTPSSPPRMRRASSAYL